MKTFKNCLLAGVVVILFPWAARLQAAVINYVGTQNDLGPHWRISSTAKPLDIDNDNVLGTDGYDVINLPVALPSYVSQMTILSSTTGGDPSYAFIDNPTSLPATFQTGTMNPSPGPGASADLFTFTLNSGVTAMNGSPISRRVRVGLLVDNLDNPVFNAASLTLVQTGGSGTGSASAATTSASFNDQLPDWIFFDIIGAEAGDTFVIRGVGGSSGYATLGGVAFDSSTQSLLVTNLSDNGGPGTLRGIMGSAVANGLVQFSTNLSGQTILLTNGEILLNQNVTIDATALPGGIQINGNANSRVFEVASNNTVTLNELTITNGYGTNGGGIYNSGTLTLNECTVSGNSVTNGMATGTGTGGGKVVGGEGGGIYNGVGTLTLNECTVSGNSAASYGGGIYNDGNPAGALTLNECTLSGNLAGFGGGILSEFNALTLNQCTLCGNSDSTTQGGGIASSMDTVAVYNSIVAGNTPNNIYALTSTYNFAGVNLTNGTPLLAPLGNYGGPTQTMPPLPGSPAIDTGSDSATNLFATDQRGFPRLSRLHVDIGAVEVQFTTLVVSNTLDTGAGSLRQAIAQTSTNPVLVTFNPALSGQTITLTSAELLLTNNLTIDATALPGGIQINGDANYSVFEVASNTTVALNGLTITNGVAKTSGGGVYNSGTLTLNQCTVSGNSAFIFGGGIYNGIGTMTLNECTLAGNSVTSSDGSGGGIYNNAGGSGGGGTGTTPGTLTLNECTLAGNSVITGGGGGIYNGLNTLTVNQCTVSGNSVISGHGGGIYNGKGTVTMYDSIVASNTVDNFYAITNTGNFTGVNLTNGTPLLAPLGNYGGLTQTMPPLPGSPAIDAGSDAATNLFATDQRGFPRLSGLQVDIGAVEVQFTTLVVSNTMDSAPGSLRQTIAQAATNLSIATITFAPNLSGQTITLTSGEVLLNNTMTIDASPLPQGVQINGNANDRIFEVDSLGPVNLNSLTLTNGSANDGYGGGGILNYSTLVMNQCTLAGNAAYGNVGGGVENDGTNTLNECTLAGDSAGIGGGLFNYGTLALNECTVSGNSANSGYGGGGVYNFGNLALTGSIVAANTASVGADLFNEESLAYTGANLVKNVVNLGPSGSVTGPAPINATALLTPLGNYGGPTPTMPPLPGSPAIDAAGATSFTTDQRGFPRVVGYGPDLGAVEGVYNPAGPGKLGEVTLLGNGAVQFGFTNYSDMSFTVLASTNVALPLNLWTSLGTITETSPGSGEYQFTDLQATNNPLRFYRARWP